jgi:hypothetical protein
MMHDAWVLQKQALNAAPLHDANSLDLHGPRAKLGPLLRSSWCPVVNIDDLLVPETMWTPELLKKTMC